MKDKNPYYQGVFAERLAAWYLRLKGYRILAQRFKTPVGEVDILAMKGWGRRRTLCAVEVKYRANIEAGLYAVLPAHMARIRRATEWWLQNNPQALEKVHIRFDVVAIAPYHWIRHIKHAF